MRKPRKLAYMSAVSMAVLKPASPPDYQSILVELHGKIERLQSAEEHSRFGDEYNRLADIFNKGLHGSGTEFGKSLDALSQSLDSALSQQPAQPQVPNYQNPAYQQFSPYQQAVQPPVNSSLRHPQQEQSQSQHSGWDKPMKRRTAIKILLGAAATGIGLTVFGQLWLSGALDINAYEGKIIGLSKINSKEEEIFYKDVCHTQDVDLGGQTARLGITISSDGNYNCPSGDSVRSNDYLRILLSPDTYYRVDSWERDAFGLEIFNAAKLGKNTKVSKGTRAENGHWLRKVYDI